MDLHMMLKIEHEEGIEIGKEEGIEIGEERGDLQRLLRSLKALQNNGISFEDACRMLELTEEEIRVCKTAE